MPELQAHSATDESNLQHRSAPSGAVDPNLHRIGAELRVAGNQRFAPATIHDGVQAILSFNFQGGTLPQIVKVDAPFDLRLDDVPIHFVAQIRMRTKEVRRAEFIPRIGRCRVHTQATLLKAQTSPLRALRRLAIRLPRHPNTQAQKYPQHLRPAIRFQGAGR